MKRVLAILLSVALALCLGACGQSPETAVATWQEQYDLGVRYLEEGNYEEAIIAFSAAIEIDPKQAEGYVGLADAYIGVGNYEKADEVIAQGQKACGDNAIFDRVLNNDDLSWMGQLSSFDSFDSYADAIQSLMDEIEYNAQDDLHQSWHRGYYCDLDNDGHNELVVRYLKEIDGELSHICGVWDTEGDKVYNILNKPFGIEENSTVATVTIYSFNGKKRLRLVNREIENSEDHILDAQLTKTFLCNNMALTPLHNECCKTYYRQDDAGEYIYIDNPNKYSVDPSLSYYEIDGQTFASENDYWAFRNSSEDLDVTFSDSLELSAYEFLPEGVEIEGYLLPELMSLLSDSEPDNETPADSGLIM